MQRKDGASSGSRRALFLDRDGVINRDGGYAHRLEELELTPTAVKGVRIANQAGCRVIVVTNQSGVARGLFAVADVERFHEAIQRRLASEGARIDKFYYCPYHPDGSIAQFTCEHEDRKPRPGMLLRAIRDYRLDPATSFMIGDRPSDLEAARAAGVPAQLIETNVGDLAAMVRGWLDPAKAPFMSNCAFS